MNSKKEKKKEPKSKSKTKSPEEEKSEMTKHHGWPDIDFKKTLGCG